MGYALCQACMRAFAGARGVGACTARVRCAAGACLAASCMRRAVLHSPRAGGTSPPERGGYPFRRSPGPLTLAFRKAFKDLGAACTGCSPQLRCCALPSSPRPPQRSSRHTFRPAPLQACRCRPTPRTPPRRPPPEPRHRRSSPSSETVSATQIAAHALHSLLFTCRSMCERGAIRSNRVWRCTCLQGRVDVDDADVARTYTRRLLTASPHLMQTKLCPDNRFCFVTADSGGGTWAQTTFSLAGTFGRWHTHLAPFPYQVRPTARA
jgi:hypothetical protein